MLTDEEDSRIAAADMERYLARRPDGPTVAWRSPLGSERGVVAQERAVGDGGFLAGRTRSPR